MQDISLLNSIIGPVMRGPSSSHSAAPYFIARTIRHLALHKEEQLLSARISFDPRGSFAQVYTNQGSDESFAAGLWGEEITSKAYRTILPNLMEKKDFTLSFVVTKLTPNDHPNRVELQLEVLQQDGSTRTDLFKAISTGGGMFVIDSLNEESISITGGEHVLLLEGDIGAIKRLITKNTLLTHAKAAPELTLSETTQLIVPSEFTDQQLREFETVNGILRARFAPAVQLPVVSTDYIITSATEVIASVQEGLADYALDCETERLGMTNFEVRTAFKERCQLMLQTVESSFSSDPAQNIMRFLSPSAVKMREASVSPIISNPFLQNASAAAIAVMEANANHEVVVAAPTAGSSGIIPGVLYALSKEGISLDGLTDALQVMALTGALFAVRGSFAAETGGCAVETGASAAMAAAGLAYISGGSTEQVFQAASLCIMNTLGLVCDPVGGEVEIPCHARNISAVAHSQSAALAILSGFKAVMPFDELVDTTVEVGDLMHADLRCTARGGCAITPAACSLYKKPQ